MKTHRVMLGLALTFLLAVSARANCFVPYSFANYGFDPSTYSYIHFGTEANQSTAAIVGRFWEVGARAFHNEGTYDDSQWLTSEGPDQWDFQGWLGSYGVNGCVRDEMILLLQDTTQDESDAVFVAGRVLFDGYTEHEFPFWVTGLDWEAVRFPAACREHQRRRGHTVTVDLALDTITGGFYGEPGMSPTDTITAYSVWTARGNTDPGRSTEAWNRVATVPFTGEPAELSGLQVDCSGSDEVMIAVGLEFDHGQFSSDFVGKPTRIVCDKREADPSDADADGTEDGCDNCPDVSNQDQRDRDNDGVGDACDRCPLDPAVGAPDIDPDGPSLGRRKRPPCRDLHSGLGL